MSVMRSSGPTARHANLMAEMRGLATFGIEVGGRAVSYFPMAHVAERNASHYFPMVYGLTVTCCPDPRTVAAYLPEVRPTSFFAVPRISAIRLAWRSWTPFGGPVVPDV